MGRIRSLLGVVLGTAIVALSGSPAWAASAAWTTLTWSTTFPQPYANSEAQGLVLDGRLYSFGGFDSTKSCCTPTARAYRLDPATGWTALASMPAQNGTGYGGVTHAGVATDGTYIYWAGGYTSNSAGTGQIYGTKEVWRYNPVANAYARMPDLPLTRAAGQLAYLDGRLHYFGGTNLARTADVGEHWALDLANPAGGWVPRAPLPNPRHHLGAAVLGGKIYGIGGQHGHDAATTTQDDVHAYDPGTDAWTPRADLPKAVGHISTFALDGRIIVLGGETANGVSVADVNAYDPQTNTWAGLTPLPSPRRGGVAGAIAGILYYSTGSRTTTTYKGVPDTLPAWPKRINFQPAGAAVPAGYRVDSGLAYDAARGYGWIREDSLDAATPTPLDISPNARDRGLLSDQRLDTLLHMQFPSTVSSTTAVRTPAAWELAVPVGTYDVTVSVGDAAANYDSVHRINVEGEVAVGPFQPTASSRFASATKRVTVSDGRLTIDARGGTNTKINYVDVVPQPAVDLKLNFQPDAAPVPAGYTKDGGAGYSETRGFGWIREDSLSTTHVPLDVSPNARDRNRLSDQRLDTLIHMQYPQSGTSTSAVRTPAAWEAAVPNGRYDVTVSVGDADPNYDSTHRIRVEGVVAVSGFVPTSANRFAQATTTVAVGDGRLTVDAIGGTNTKINFVTIKTAAS